MRDAAGATHRRRAAQGLESARESALESGPALARLESMERQVPLVPLVPGLVR